MFILIWTTETNPELQLPSLRDAATLCSCMCPRPPALPTTCLVCSFVAYDPLGSTFVRLEAAQESLVIKTARERERE